MGEDASFLGQRELGWIATLHEPRKHLFQNDRARPQFLVETVLDETGNRVVKTVREGEGSAAISLRAAVACAHVREKFLGGISRGRLGAGGRDKFTAMIVGTAGESFLPRLRMRRYEIVAIGELVDLFPRQAAEKILRQLAQERVAQTVNGFEVLEEENQAFEVRRGQLAVDAVERMSDRMGNLGGREILLQLINIVSDGDNLLVLRLGYSPRQNVNLARILRKISCNLLTDK